MRPVQDESEKTKKIKDRITAILAQEVPDIQFWIIFLQISA